MTTGNKWWLGAVLATLVLAGPTGCGKKEIDELKTKVATLEKELADTKTKLADTEKQAQEARAEAEQMETDFKARNTELAKVRVERDRCRQDLTALKKRR